MNKTPLFLAFLLIAFCYSLVVMTMLNKEYKTAQWQMEEAGK